MNMKLKMKIINIVALMTLCFIASCGEEDEITSYVGDTLTMSSRYVSANGGQVRVNFKPRCSWWIELYQDAALAGCVVMPAEGLKGDASITVFVPKNDTGKQRQLFFVCRPKGENTNKIMIADFDIVQEAD